MNEKTKATLTNLDTWKRGLFMLVFAMISGVAKLIVTLVAVFQFVTLLFKGQANQTIIPFGQNLGTYLYQITLFLTFKTDDMPFPFVDFPDKAPGSNLHEDSEENIATIDTTSNNTSTDSVTTDAAATKNDKDIGTAANEDSKDGAETEPEKDK